MAEEEKETTPGGFHKEPPPGTDLEVQKQYSEALVALAERVRDANTALCKAMNIASSGNVRAFNGDDVIQSTRALLVVTRVDDMLRQLLITRMALCVGDVDSLDGLLDEASKLALHDMQEVACTCPSCKSKRC